MEFAWVESHIQVLGSNLARDKCESLAEVTLGRYASRAGYYRNLKNSHLVGRSGEIAVANVLKATSHQVENAFADPSKDALADIIWNDLEIDVKTWTETYWPKWGRCVSVKQYETLKSKASHVVWCTTNIVDNKTNWRVNLVGWNFIEEIESFPKRWTGPAGKQVYNFQANEDQLRTLRTFFELYA